MKEMPAPDLLIFDIDGVLLDVRRSFPEVIRGAVFEGWRRFCGGASDCTVYGPEHERVMKRHGGFNDDFDLAWALLEICCASGEKKLSAAFPSPERLAAETASCRDDVPGWAYKRYGDLAPRDKVRSLCCELYGYGGRGGLHELETPLLRGAAARAALRPRAAARLRRGAESPRARVPRRPAISSDSRPARPRRTPCAGAPAPGSRAGARVRG